MADVARQSLNSATLPFPQGSFDRPEAVVASSRVTIKVLDIVASPNRIQDQFLSPRRRRFTVRNSTVHWAWRNSHRRAGRRRPMPICGFAAVPLCKSENEQETLLRLATVPPRKREALPFASVCAVMLVEPILDP
jgi:hypothetical protein